ncbi:MAG TPA: TetR/AcrR family transcriptional regulator [Chryseosolibacter sp.]
MPKTDNKRQVILDVALRLFAKHGYDATPISRIAKVAGVSQGLMYNFFAGKKELLRAMIVEGAKDIEESMKAYAAMEDASQAIEVHVTETIRIIKKKKEFWRLLHALRLQGSVLEDVEDLFKEIVSTVTMVFEKVFRDMGIKNPKLEAQLFLTQIDGMVIMYLQNEKFPIRQLGKQLINRYTKNN